MRAACQLRRAAVAVAARDGGGVAAVSGVPAVNARQGGKRLYISYFEGGFVD